MSRPSKTMSPSPHHSDDERVFCLVIRFQVVVPGTSPGGAGVGWATNSAEVVTERGQCAGDEVGALARCSSFGANSEGTGWCRADDSALLHVLDAVSALIALARSG